MDSLNNNRILTSDFLRTWDLGKYEGKKETAKVKATIHDHIKNPDKPVPGGESYNQFLNRVIPGFKEATKVLPDKALVVTHSQVLKAINEWNKQGQPDLQNFDTSKIIKEKVKSGAVEEINTGNKSILVARHGDTAQNKSGSKPEYVRSKDVNLAEKGIKEAAKNAEILANQNVSTIVSSPLPRAVETADIIDKTLRHKFGGSLAPNIPTYYKSSGTPIYRDTTEIPFADGGPLHDRDINGKLLQSTYAPPLGNMFREGGPFGEDHGVFDYASSVYASQPGNYYRTGGQFPRPYSLPEDSWKQGGNNLHNSVYASSNAQYFGIYKYGGSFEMPRQQMYMPLDNVERYGGSQQNAKTFSVDGENHKVYLKTSPTGNGKGVQGHIMVNHPTEDKGKWDTIDLTDKAGAKTVAQGVAATKKWHQEHPNQYADGGPIIPAIATYNPGLPSNYATDYAARLKEVQSNAIDPKTGAPFQGSGGQDSASTGTGGNYRPLTPQERLAKITELESYGVNDLRPDILEQYLNLKNNKPYYVASARADKYMYEPYDLRTYTPMTPQQLAAAYPEPELPKPTIGYPTNPYTGEVMMDRTNVDQAGNTFQVNRPYSQFLEMYANSPEKIAERKAVEEEGLRNQNLLDFMSEEQKKEAKELKLTPEKYLEKKGLPFKQHSAVSFANGGSILSMSNTPQLEGEGKDLTYPDGAYVYGRGGNLFAGGGPIYPTNQQLAQFLNPEYQRVTQGQEVTVRPTPYQLQQAKNNAEKYNALNIKPEVAESTKPNIAPVDKNITEKAIAQKAAERKIVAKEIKNSPMLTKEQKTDILMSPQKLDENIYLAYQKKPETLKAAKEYSTADKATNILRNPLVAASYFMKPGEFNMPMNYSELERSPNYSDETWNRNAVGQGINFASYLNPVGLALHTADNALYTASDLDKALESGKIEDWKQAGLSAANTGLDLIGSRYIGNSGRLLNTGEQATLNAMNTSNRLGLNSGVNNYLGTRVFPNISSQVVRSADDIAAARLIPQINPNAVNYNPLSRNLYNQAVTVGNTQNALEATKDLGLFNHDIDLNPNIVYKESPSGKIIPFNNESGKSLQTEYIDELKDYYNSSEFKRIMKEEYPDVDIEKYKKATLENLKKELEYNPSAVPDNASGVYTNKNSSSAAYMPGHTPTFKQRVANANTNPYMYEGDRGTSQINNPVAAWHELSHQRTNSDELLPDWFTRSFLEENAGIDASNLEYYGRPTEFDVRMKQLKKDLKAQGIHDYFKGPVTEEHIRQLDAANLKKHGDFLFRNMTDEYRKLKKSGASLEELDAVKDKFYTDIENLEKKVGALKTSQDTQDLLQRWDTEFLAKMAKKLPVVVGGAYLGNEFLQNNGLNQNSSGQFKMGGQARVVKSSQLFNR